MNKNDKAIKIAKKAAAVLIAVLPCALYLFLIKSRASSAVLYTAPSLWQVAAVSLAAAVLAYAALVRKPPYDGSDSDGVPDDGDAVPCDSDGVPDDGDAVPCDSDGISDGGNGFSTLSENEASFGGDPAFSGEAEYPELFSDNGTDPFGKTAAEGEDTETGSGTGGTESANDMSAKIAFAIWAQKDRSRETAEYEGFADGTEDDGDGDEIWKSYLESGNSKKSELSESLYGIPAEDLPTELPEGYIQREAQTEAEREFSEGYTVKRITLGETLLSKVLCVSAAAVISLGVAFASSFSLTAHTDDGFVCGSSRYVWADVETLTVSQRLFGSLSVKAKTSDGRETELFPAATFKGDCFYDKYESVYALMAQEVRRASSAGAQITVRDGDSIDKYYMDADDASYDYISQIINEGNGKK